LAGVVAVAFLLKVLEYLEFVGVRAEAFATLGTMAVDLFNHWDLEVLPDSIVWYVPRCIHYYSQSL
jgi:hypothetical protein